MAADNLILIETLCPHYEIEISFFEDLYHHGLITIVTVEERRFVHQNDISDIEKIIRLHYDLNVNIEGIDIVLNLLKKEKELQEELNAVRNRLKLYEGE